MPRWRLGFYRNRIGFAFGFTRDPEFVWGGPRIVVLWGPLWKGRLKISFRRGWGS